MSTQPVITSSVRQSSIQQTSAPARSISVSLPLQSVVDSRVLVIIISTNTGGALSHVPTSQVWDQVQLIGTNGFMQVGDLLISAWLSKPGITIYSAGNFQFAGFLGNSPEYGQAFVVELTDLRLGSLALSQQTWEESLSNVVTGGAVAVGQSRRGVVGFAFAADHHQFLQPASPFALLSQTANSGFFASPFSASTNYATQNSNDLLDASFSFDGGMSPAGLLLFNVVPADNSIDSLQGLHGTTAFLAYPSQQQETSAFLSPGGSNSFTSSGYLAVEPGTVIVRTEANLEGATSQSTVNEANIYSYGVAPQTTDAFVDVFNIVTEEVEVGLLGTVNKAATVDSIVVGGDEKSSGSDGIIGKDLFHFTDAYILDPKALHMTDALLMSTPTVDHTADARALFQGSGEHTTSAALGAPLPNLITHNTDACVSADHILMMTGWELRNPLYECYYGFSPDYSGVAGLMTVTATAQRPGSQGGYGLRIDNDGYAGTSWWLPYPASKTHRDNLGTEEIGGLGNFYSEVWFTFWFRGVDLPLGGHETILSDDYTVLYYIGDPQVPVYGYSFAVSMGMNLTDSYANIGFSFGSGSPFLGLGPFNYITEDPHGWHKLEVRAYMPGGVLRLSEASSTNPAFLEGYIDGQLAMASSTNYPVAASGILGIQNRAHATRYRVDFDDYIISTRRLGDYDLSVKLHSPKADGTHVAWTSTPDGDYRDVASMPIDPAEYKISSTVGQKSSIKVYEGGDSDPYPAVLHALSFNLVRGTSAAPVSFGPTLKTFVRQGVTEIDLYSWKPHVGWRALILSNSPFDNGTWADAIYDLEYGVHKTVDATEHKVLNMSICVLVSPFSYSHYTDAALFGEGTITSTTDALLARTEQHTTDAHRIAQGLIHFTDTTTYSDRSGAHSGDAAISGESSISFSTDATMERATSMTTDAVVVSVRGSVHTTDISMAAQVDGYHLADGSIGALRDLPHSTDLIPYVLVEQVHNTDAYRFAEVSLSHLANGRMIKDLPVTHLADALKRATIQISHTTNGVVYRQIEQLHFTNGVLQGERSLLMSTNAHLMPVVTIARLHTTSTTLSQVYTQTTATNALLKIYGSINFSTDSHLQGQNSGNHSTNTRLIVPSLISAVHTTNAYIIGTVDSTHSANSLIKKTFELLHTADSFIELSPERWHTVSSALILVRNVTQSVSSFTYIVPDAISTVDTLLALKPTLSHLTDTLLKKEFNVAHTTFGNLFKETDLTFQANARLASTLTLNNTTDAVLATEKLMLTNALLYWQVEKISILAASLAGEANAAGTTDAVKQATVTLFNSSDASLFGEVQAQFTTSIATAGEVQVQSTSNSYLAFELYVFTNASTFGETASSHSTSGTIDNSEIGIFEDPESDETLGLFEGVFT